LGGIRAFNVQPGFVSTERNELAVREYGRTLQGAAPPSAIGAVVKWLVTDAEAANFSGQTIEAQEFCRERGLHVDWD
jgi:NAD(P)-dependent dehydrogenase (short-subunit alcohol dehydrogenase family)